MRRAAGQAVHLLDMKNLGFDLHESKRKSAKGRKRFLDEFAW